MTNVIAFLEAMGQDAGKSRLQGEDYAAAVDALGLDDAPRQALLQRDSSRPTATTRRTTSRTTSRTVRATMRRKSPSSRTAATE
jgi:hypothetical protein